MNLSDSDILSAAERALSLWPISAREIRLASRSENVVLKVTAQDDRCYALRIHRPGYNARDALNSEVVWEQALNQAGISTPAHIATREGAYYAGLSLAEEHHDVGIIEWFPGELLSDRIMNADADEAESYFADMGALLGRLHEHTAAWQPPETFTRRTWDADGLIGLDPLWGQFWASQALTPAQKKLCMEARESLHAELSQFSKDRSSYGLIHADLHPRNVLINGAIGRHTLSAIDFDDCGYSFYAYDIAVALGEFQDHPQADRLETALLAGYASVRKLPDLARQLRALVIVRQLITIGWMTARPEVVPRAHLISRLPPILSAARAFLSAEPG